MPTSPPLRVGSSARLAELFHAFFLVLATATFLLAVTTSRLVLLGTHLTVPSLMMVGVVLALTSLSRWSWCRSAQLQFVMAIFGLTALGITLVGRSSSLAGTKELRLNAPLRTYKSEDEWFDGYCGPDPVYGLVGVPSGVFREHHRDFDVTYRTDADGWRVTPKPSKPAAPEIVILGCSFTWGIGVEDTETYPWILGTEAWPDHRIRNISCPAWGTVQVVVALDRLLESGVKPKAVLYGYMLHAQRNYLRKSWRTLVNNDFPYFTAKNGELTYHGLKKATVAMIDDSPQLDQAEIELTIALIDHMHRACRERGIPFAVFDLKRGDGVPAALLAAGRVPLLDLADVWLGFHPNDGHPAADWHRMVAHCLAASPQVSETLGLPELYRPGSVPLDAVDIARFHLELPRVDRQPSKNKAILHRKDGGYRVDGIECATDQPWYVGLTRSRHALRNGKKYAIHLQGRADAPRSMDVCVTTASDPSKPAALYRTIELGTAWSDHHLEFVANEEEIDAVISFRVSSSRVPLEIRNVHLVDEQGEEVLPKPLILQANHSSRR